MKQTFSSFLTRLEVIDRLDDLADLDGIADVVHDVVHCLVRHGTLVERRGIHRGREDTLHLLLELGNGEALLCLGT